MIGQTLSHYSVLDTLGEGGMGVVYRGVDTRLNRPVALKVLPHEATADPERVRRFTQEAQAASALNHPNIITIYDVGEAGGVSFIAMEYVAGRTLDQMIGRKGLKVADALKYAAQIADALAAAHAAGIVHRDLKPGNVMVTNAGRVKVLDFGLAKQVPFAGADLAATRTMHAGGAPHTEEGTILGTVAYMSPEQAEGKQVDARSDIFSFGSLLYEMVTGQRAFQGETRMSTLAAILQNEPRPASEITAGAPRDLDGIIAHCLRKDPDRRFQHLDDVKTLIEGLQEASASQKVAVARDEMRAAPASRPRIIAAGVLLLVAVVGAGWWLFRDWQPRSAAGTPPQPSAQATPAPGRLSTGGPPSKNPEANRYFEQAMQSMFSFDLPRLQQMLARAIELDPHFAEARAWHGFTNCLMLAEGFSNDSALLYQAEDEMRRALQDDPTLARAHAGFAFIYTVQGRRELVPGEVEQALRANPGDQDALLSLVNHHAMGGEYADAERVAKQVLDRLPLFFPARMVLGEVLREQGDLAGAIREEERILEQDPRHIAALTFLARTHLDTGDVLEARATMSRVPPAVRSNYRIRLMLATLLATEGKREEALKAMDEDVLKWAALVTYATADIADVYATLGDTAKALDWLDRAVRSGDGRAEYFRRNPLLASVRDHPRFQQILESIAYRRQQRTPVR